MPAVFSHCLQVSDEVLDQNGHVNNVAYVQWMQDSAIRHSAARGATTAYYRELGVTWVARSHFIEYLRPALSGDRIEVLTWVADLRRARSLRKYKFIRPADGRVLARAQTDWVLVDTGTGRPCGIPEELRARFEVVAEGEEP